MCDVSSRAVFCVESIECSLGTVSKFFLKLLVTIPVVRIFTGKIVHFRFHIRFISTQNSCNLASFPLNFAQHFCLPVLPHLSVCSFSLYLIIISGLFAVTSLSLCINIIISSSTEFFTSQLWLGNIHPILGCSNQQD